MLGGLVPPSLRLLLLVREVGYALVVFGVEVGVGGDENALIFVINEYETLLAR